jgi:phosphoribosylglycinamide formyltransferase-1
MKNIVILISGDGSNMDAIIRTAKAQNWEKHLHAKVAAVISNRPAAKGLGLAQHHGITTQVVDHTSFANATNPREAFDTALIKKIDEHAPALVVLAGFMRILTPKFVAHYEGRLVNIHPALLPAFPGLHTHQRAIEAGCKFAGATVHQVSSELDHGTILAQAVVPVTDDDTADSLAARVLSQEHLIYPTAIAKLVKFL